MTIKTADRRVDCDLAVWDKKREIERQYSSHGRGTSIVTGVKDEAAIGHVGGSVFTSSDFQGGIRRRIVVKNVPEFFLIQYASGV